MIDALSSQWQAQTWQELVAFVLSIAYVILAARQNIWCWACALLSTGLYSYVFYAVSLPFQSALNLYYIVMAIIGFLGWQKATQNNHLILRKLSFLNHLVIISTGLLSTLFLLWLGEQWFSSDYLLLDAWVTIFSIIATILTARRYIDNWYYWMVINSAAIYLFVMTNLLLTALLMMIYTIVAVYGVMNWHRSLAVQSANT